MMARSQIGGVPTYGRMPRIPTHSGSPSLRQCYTTHTVARKRPSRLFSAQARGRGGSSPARNGTQRTKSQSVDASLDPRISSRASWGIGQSLRRDGLRIEPGQNRAGTLGSQTFWRVPRTMKATTTIKRSSRSERSHEMTLRQRGMALRLCRLAGPFRGRPPKLEHELLSISARTSRQPLPFGDHSGLAVVVPFLP